MKAFLEKLNAKRLGSYDADSGLLKEHFGIEETVLAGGYGYRQVLELVQNGADAMLEASEGALCLDDQNRIHVILRGRRLYVANTGAPLSEDGLDALLRSHSSPKRGIQIGRFGLGFKSLLKLRGRIDLFTREAGSIRFDPERCRAELRERYRVTDAPGLRLAWPLGNEERHADPVCADLAWAETIVRVEVGADDLAEHIRQEIRSFPAEFLLFLPVATVLMLDDGEEPARVIRLGIDGAEHVLHDGKVISRWRIAQRDVRVIDAGARADATHIHARDTVPLAWAVPVEGRREESGRFWAFFPTHTQTYVPGILNAPWKLNSDRNAIIGGEWNSALMAQAARLIVEALPGLSTEDDPGRPLDAFPRQLERRDEDAAPLIEELWNLLGTAAVVPDSTGALQLAQALLRHPKDTEALAAAWQSLAGEHQRRQLVHASCLVRQRASRLNALAQRLDRPEEGENYNALCRCSAETWFGSAASKEASQALDVLRLAQAYSNDSKPLEWNQVRSRLAIVPAQCGKLVTARDAVLAPEGVSVPGRAVVSSELLSNRDARRILTDILGVKELDDGLWATILREALQVPDYPENAKDSGWKRFWSRLRCAPARVSKDLLARSADQVRVRRRDGQWAAPDRVLLPGSLVDADDPSPSRDVLVDDEVHAEDRASLLTIGITDVPKGTTILANHREFDSGGSLLESWRSACRGRYKETQDNSASWNYLEAGRLSMPRGYHLLADLSGVAKARFTLLLLDRLREPDFQQAVSFGHRTMSVYPRIEVPHPLPWYVQSQGEVEIGSTTVPLAAIVERQSETALARLPNWYRLPSAFDRLGGAFPTIEASTSDLRSLWRAVISLVVTEEALGDDGLTALWLGAARDGVVPAELPGALDPVPISEVFVTTSVDLARRARGDGRIVVTLDEPTMRSWLQAGAQSLSNLIKADWAGAAGPPERLTAMLPELDDVLGTAARDAARCQRVLGLRLYVGNVIQHVPCVMSDGVLHVDGEQLASLSRSDRLGVLLAEIATAGWLDMAPDEALRFLGDAQVDVRRAYVAEGETLAERLCRAVGGRPEPLRSALGVPLCNMDFVLQCPPMRLAELALCQHGPAILTVLRDALEAEGLKPPARWSASAALAFATSIGFPVEFASSAQARREPEEFVSGPAKLPALHDFQVEVLDGLRDLLASRTGRRRAVISLPTGGGKTRVTVEAAVRLVLAPEGANRSVIWIAQTDELCEQAVQAFRQVWVNLGAWRTDLRVVRLWGGNPNPTGQDLGRPIVVVASIQTLNNRFGAADLQWLRRPGLVVVDECHHAITPSYTALLRWLDAEAPRTDTPDKDEPPIVGLSATPFRTDDDESHRLARRFDSRWLPANQEQLNARLRRDGVLAEACYEPLDSGVGLTDEELASLGSLGDQWEGLDFENLLEAINQRLASDVHRNERLVECIEASHESSILFFTNSVAHAQEMAARLNFMGIGAAAISGSTQRVARRYFLDRFQRGEIRVLCNHSLLTTGFDAPKTDMILIARQVFSPVRYMQMVGRGLRGEKNGGTATCRIVTVLDNLGRFQDRHPYYYCQRYFSALERAMSASVDQ